MLPRQNLGGLAERAQFFSQRGGVTAAVDHEHSCRKDLSKMSAWNSILGTLHSFHAIGVDLPYSTWSRARRAPRNSRFPGPLRGEIVPDIVGLLGLSDKDQQKVQDASQLVICSLEP